MITDSLFPTTSFFSAIGVEEVHILVDGDACTSGSFLNWQFTELKVKLGFPLLAILGVIDEAVPSGTLSLLRARMCHNSFPVFLSA